MTTPKDDDALLAELARLLARVDRSKRSIVGQIVPPGRAEVVVRFPGAELPVQADELGRFQASGLRPGPVSLRCELADGRTIETGWVTI